MLVTVYILPHVGKGLPISCYRREEVDKKHMHVFLRMTGDVHESVNMYVGVYKGGVYIKRMIGRGVHKNVQM